MNGEWERWTCIHGVTEELDYHSCGKCQEIAKKLGYDFSNRQTYIFTRRIINSLKRKKATKEIMKKLSL